MWPISAMLSAEAFPSGYGLSWAKANSPQATALHSHKLTNIDKKKHANSPTKSLYLILVANSNILCDYI